MFRLYFSLSLFASIDLLILGDKHPELRTKLLNNFKLHRTTLSVTFVNWIVTVLFSFSPSTASTPAGLYTWNTQHESRMPSKYPAVTMLKTILLYMLLYLMLQSTQRWRNKHIDAIVSAYVYWVQVFLHVSTLLDHHHVIIKWKCYSLFDCFTDMDPDKWFLCKIWGFHGSDYEEWCLLGYYAVWLL
jgi:hypothetical protein